MIVRLNDGPYDVASLFQKATQCLQICQGISSDAVLTMPSLSDTGAGPNLVSNEFVPPAWRESMEQIKLSPFRIANSEGVCVK